jgi:hypothetical protein
MKKLLLIISVFLSLTSINGYSQNVLMGQTNFIGFSRASDGAAIPMISVVPQSNGLSNLQIGSGSGQFYASYTDIFAGGSRKLRILSNGNLGIGTATPAGILDIQSTSGLIVSGANLDPASGYSLTPLANSSKLLLGWNYTAGGGETDFITNRGAGVEGGFNFYDYSNSYSTNLLMTIKGNGKVGINCSNPTSTLTVNGKITASEIEVKNAPCSDFVFEEGYKLITLNELQQFVKTEKHLPEVPSAKEFSEKGSYNIGEMDDLLLRKVEELTLYIIEQNKSIEALKSEMAQVKNNKE